MSDASVTFRNTHQSGGAAMIIDIGVSGHIRMIYGQTVVILQDVAGHYNV